MLAAANVALKAGPYIAVLLLGVFLGYRFELPRVQAAQLALAHQQAADAQAAAAGAAQAAKEIGADKTTSDAAQAKRDDGRLSQAATASDMRAAIATQAAQPSQDGAVAPVLANALAGLKAAQDGAGVAP